MNLSKFITKYRLLMAFIIAAGLALRVFRLEERFSFLAEQNVKAWTIKSLVIDHKIPLVGTEAVSYLHHLFYPPLFQFLGAIVLYLADLNPASMEIFLILLFVPSALLIFLIAAELSGKKTAFFASLIYSFSIFVDVASRFVWIVGPMLLISLAALFIIMKISFFPKKIKYYFLLGFILGLGFNFHYQTSILFISIILWLFLYRKRQPFLKSISIFIFPIIIAFSSLIIFDLRHDFFNLRGVLLLLTGNKTNSFMQNILNAVDTYWKPVFSVFSSRIAVTVNAKWYQFPLSLVADLSVILFAFVTYRKSNTFHRPIFLFIFLNFILALFILPFIQNRFYGSEYYLYFLIPFAVILISIGIKNLFLRRQFTVLIFFGILFIYENMLLFKESFVKLNYTQQIHVLDQLLRPFSYQKNGPIRIYAQDFPSENYSYLIYYLTRKNQIDFNRVKFFEPWQTTKTWDIKINRQLFN